MRKVLFILLVFMISSLYAAEIPTTSYVYTTEDEAMAVPSPFDFEAIYYPEQEGSSFADLFVYEGELYILDAGLGNVKTLEGEEISFSDEEGTPYSFVEPSGLFITDDFYYIADRGDGKVLAFDKDSRYLSMKIENPDTSSLGVSVPFVPSKIAVDSAGNVYVLVDDLYYGALLFSPSSSSSEEMTFLGYYGANPTELTLAEKLDQSWKKLLNRTQRDAMERFVPVAYSSFDIDDEDFIYTCSFNITNESMKIRKINPSGKGIWDDDGLVFGDMIPAEDVVEGLESTSRFIDVDIHDGFLSALDAARGHIFTYDSDGKLLSVIGGKGTQWGTFVDPQHIESDDDFIYVLDESDSSITVFRKSYYGKALFTASSLFSDGLYMEAMPYFEQVLRMSPDLEMAHLGLGKAYQKEGRSKEALEELRLSGDREQYSNVFDTIRLEWARDNLALLIMLIIVAIVAYKLIKRKFNLHFRVLKDVRKAFAPMFHPSDLMWEMKMKKTFSFAFSSSVVLLFFILHVIRYFSTGYAFNTNIREDFNILVSLMNTVGLFFLWVTINWAVSTISDGKGTYKDIYCASSYALIPVEGAMMINLILSHVLTLDEGAFIYWIEAFAYLVALFILLLSVATVHEFMASKMLSNFIITLIGMAFVLFLMFLFVILIENTVNIFSIIINEITLRR